MLPICSAEGCDETSDHRYSMHLSDGRAGPACEGHGADAMRNCPAAKRGCGPCACPPPKKEIT